MTLREQIKQAMEEDGMTQVVMAKRMGMTQPELSAILSDKRELGMTEATAMKAAKALRRYWVLSKTPPPK